MFITLAGKASKDKFIVKELLEDAERYKDVGNYAISDSLYNEAKKIACRQETYWCIMAKISHAELHRKAGFLSKSLDELKKIPDEEKYPELMSKKYGRIAAVYNELPEEDFYSKKDSVKKYLNKAIKIAEQYKIKEQLAVLYNELGFYLDRNGSSNKAIEYLSKSRQIFLSLADSENYANATLNLLNAYWNQDLKKEFFDLAEDLHQLIKDKKWYALKARFYREIMKNISLEKSDSINFYKYEIEALRNEFEDFKLRNNIKLHQLELLYETEKVKDKARALNEILKVKQQYIESQKKKNLILIIFIVILLLFSILIIYSFIKQRKTSKKLQRINENYQILLSELKHRVKNNLQMLIGMLDIQVSEFNKGKSIEEITNETQSRLQAIALLHDKVINAQNLSRVKVKEYITEIVNLIKSAYFQQKNIQLINDIKVDEELPSDIVFCLGIILVELLTNSFKHAFYSIEDPKIHIIFNKTDNKYYFKYADNGVGFEHKNTQKGTGSLIIEGMIQQLNAKFDIKSTKNGVVITIIF